MLEITAIDHLVLRTTQVTEMLHFYCQVLGCTMERETPADIGLTQLRAGTALIDLVAVDSRLGSVGGAAPSADGNNLDHFCLRIKPLALDALSSHLQSHGITMPQPTARYGAQRMGESIYIQDPDGNTVELRMDKDYD